MGNSYHWGYRRESGVESLVEWIDSFQSSLPNQRWGTWGGIVGGSSGLVGGATGTMLGSLHMSASNPIVWLPLCLWGVLAIGMTRWVVKRNRDEWGTWEPESRNLLTRLSIARWQGTLKQTLGEDGAALLNEAAGIYLRCRSTLNSPAWKAAAAGHVWGEMRDKTLASMDSAIARMLLLVTSGASASETEAILADMKAMNEEVAKAGQRHATLSGAPLGAAEGLRQTLVEMRELASADEEFLQDRLGG